MLSTMMSMTSLPIRGTSEGMVLADAIGTSGEQSSCRFSLLHSQTLIVTLQGGFLFG